MHLSKTITLSFLLGSVFFLAGCGQPSTEAGAALARTEADAEAQAVDAEAEVQPVEEAEWLTDYEAALARASEEGKAVLVNFTGSDWCPPCKLLKSDVFETDEFAAYAAENLILLEVDFPRGVQQAPELAKQNEALLGTYEVEAFPTLVVLDSQGAEVRRTTGYMPGGPSVFIKWVQG